MKKLLQSIFCLSKILVIDAKTGRKELATYSKVFGIAIKTSYKDASLVSDVHQQRTLIQKEQTEPLKDYTRRGDLIAQSFARIRYGKEGGLYGSLDFPN